MPKFFMPANLTSSLGTLTNLLHHANTKLFLNSFFTALGWAAGLLPLALVLKM